MSRGTMRRRVGCTPSRFHSFFVDRTACKVHAALFCCFFSPLLLLTRRRVESTPSRFLSPPSRDIDEAVCFPYAVSCSACPFPSVNWGIPAMEAACNLHAASVIFFFYPPSLGGTLSCSFVGVEAACNPHAVSVCSVEITRRLIIFFFHPPSLGGTLSCGLVGVEAVCNPHAASVSICLPPLSVGGDFISLYTSSYSLMYNFNTVSIVPSN